MQDGLHQTLTLSLVTSCNFRVLLLRAGKFSLARLRAATSQLVLGDRAVVEEIQSRLPALLSALAARLRIPRPILPSATRTTGRQRRPSLVTRLRMRTWSAPRRPSSERLAPSVLLAH